MSTNKMNRLLFLNTLKLNKTDHPYSLVAVINILLALTCNFLFTFWVLFKYIPMLQACNWKFHNLGDLLSKDFIITMSTLTLLNTPRWIGFQDSPCSF